MTADVMPLLVMGVFAILISLVSEDIKWAFLATLVVALILQFGYEIDLAATFAANVSSAIGLFFGYVAIGGLHSVVRWHLRARRVAKSLAELKDKIPGDEVLDKRPGSTFYSEVQIHLNKMRPLRNRGLITGWIAFWPIDLVLLTFEEPIRLTFNWLASTYKRLSSNALHRAGLSEWNDME